MSIARAVAARWIWSRRDARAGRAERARIDWVIDRTIDQVVGQARASGGLQAARRQLQVSGLVARQAAERQREADAARARRPR